MIRISKVYKCFGWMHPNGTAMPNLVGRAVSIGLKTMNPAKLRRQQQEYKDYLNKIAPASFNWYTYLGCHMIYGASLEDYFVFQFDKRNDAGRREYITDISAYKYFRAFNNSIYLEDFRDKYRTYQKYKPFFAREALLINKETQEDSLQSFLDRHHDYILKPLLLSCGKGIEIIRGGMYSAKSLKEHLSLDRTGEWIAEQLIVQSGSMSRIYPASVNTVRMNAYRVGNEIVIYRPFFRTGKGNLVVDNAGAGGLFMLVDPDTGCTVSLGYDEYGNKYPLHPDTKIPLVHFQLPEWDQLRRLTEEIMNVDKTLGCCGWDFAHTDQGWVLVEGNDSHQFVCQQISSGCGCAKAMDDLMRRGVEMGTQ